MKKRILFIIILIVLSGVFLTFLFNDKYHNQSTNIISTNINVYDEETSTYVPQNTVPIGYYDIDEELTSVKMAEL